MAEEEADEEKEALREEIKDLSEKVEELETALRAATTEVFLEGKWAYFDVRGKYFFLADGRLANTWEIWNDPSLITSQKPEIYLEIAPGYELDFSLKCFHPREVIGINNYFVADFDKYDYSWQIEKDWAEKSGYSKVQEDYLRVRAEVLGFEEQ